MPTKKQISIYSLLLPLVLYAGLSFAQTEKDKKEPINETPDITFDEEDTLDESKEPLPRIQIKREKSEQPIDEEPRFIEHPNASKGLIKITRDRTYIYKVEKSPQTRASSVRFGFVEFNDLENPESGATFFQNYDQTESPYIVVDYEWQVWQSLIGKWGLTAGVGAYFATGHGRFETQTLEPRENFTFITIPFTGGAVYRMHLWEKQPLIPYGSGGIAAFSFSEIRDDDKGPKFGGALAGYFAVGGAFNMNFLDTWSMLEMDRDYGINSVYLVAEYRRYIGLTDYDFTSDFLNAGFLLEF